ncbi:MAG: hypothetical protein JWR24_4063 [Actinoallomurus sp.]|jgi:hypothetical protein|nr:hypothetical protein [Actinoallomurus sp.]
MSRGRNSLLGQGGQRKKLDRSAMRGAPGAGQADQDDAARRKQELVKKLREKTEERKAADTETPGDS